jgi:hypothetical protein
MLNHTRPVAVAVSSVLTVLLLGSGMLLAKTAKDPIVGTWVLDLAKSTFSGNIPQKRLITFETTNEGAIREIARTEQANGGWDEVAYTAREDGKDYPISNSVLDTISLKRVDARTVERMGKVRGQVVETRTRTVSPDGRTMTITTKGTNNGAPYQSVQVFERMSDSSK